MNERAGWRRVAPDFVAGRQIIVAGDPQIGAGRSVERLRALDAEDVLVLARGRGAKRRPVRMGRGVHDWFVATEHAIATAARDIASPGQVPP